MKEIWELHYDTAQDNISIAEKLRKYSDSNFHGWIAVILFYAAYQYLCAYLLKKKICDHIPGHHKRYYDKKAKKYVDGTNDLAKMHLGEVGSDYIRLSEIAYSPRYVPKSEKYSRKIVDDCFRRVKKISNWMTQEGLY